MGFPCVKPLILKCHLSSSHRFFIPKWSQNEAQNGANIADKLTPKLNKKTTRKMSTFGSQNGAQIRTKLVKKTLENCIQNLSPKCFHFGSQKWSVWSARAGGSWTFLGTGFQDVKIEATRSPK
jgi:hypothetical protein